MSTPTQQTDLLRRVRICLALFIAGLVLSGLTAFPLRTELGLAVRVLQTRPLHAAAESSRLSPWIERVSQALDETDASYPFLAYGTDWLAFAHLVIAVAFIGPYMDPVRNKWVIAFGLIACAGVIPLAMIAGQVRGIPMGWRLIDCSFGVFGAIPLLVCRRAIEAMEREVRQRAPAQKPDVNTRNSSTHFPQRLKPRSFPVTAGTTEVVPFQNCYPCPGLHNSRELFSKR